MPVVSPHDEISQHYFCDDVKDFHDKFGLITPRDFVLLEPDLFEFRMKFFHEELKEFIDSYNDGDLATAIDSLIDLVYITCGTALFHGINPDRFETALMFFYRSDRQLPDRDGIDKPHLLTTDDQNEIASRLHDDIESYGDAHRSEETHFIPMLLVNLYLDCIYAADLMGFDFHKWTVLWNDVQRANMAKERATSASQSKRGSSFDVIKPAGWVPPRTEEIVAGFLGESDE